MTRIGIILGALVRTATASRSPPVAKWVSDIDSCRDDAEFELFDLRGYPLPNLDEPLPASMASTRTSTIGSGQPRRL